MSPSELLHSTNEFVGIWGIRMSGLLGFDAYLYPSIVKVLPDPVYPYANIVAWKPYTTWLI